MLASLIIDHVPFVPGQLPDPMNSDISNPFSVYLVKLSPPLMMAPSSVLVIVRIP